jgi:hypothetical protein
MHECMDITDMVEIKYIVNYKIKSLVLNRGEEMSIS